MTSMSPREHILNMVKTTQLNEEYSFEIDGDAADAQNFVHRMRVALSQLRGEVKLRGRKPKKFKVILKSTKFSAKTNKSTVTLIRCTSTSDINNDLIDALNIVTDL